MQRWAEVNLEALRNNCSVILEAAGSLPVMAVVKADAYGHGAVEVVKTLSGCGIGFFGVTETREALEILPCLSSGKVLVMGPFLPQEIEEISAPAVMLTVSSFSQLESLSSAGRPFTIHLKIETGLGRTGFKVNEIRHALKLIGGMENISLAGAYTHFSSAGEKDGRQTDLQYAEFSAAMDIIRDEGYGDIVFHACNSEGFIRHPGKRLDMVRIGNLFYGQGHLEGLRDIWQAKFRLTGTYSLPAGHPVGYGGSERLKKDTLTGIVPYGFYHGFGMVPESLYRSKSGLCRKFVKNIMGRDRQYVRIRETECNVLGRPGMQLTMVDLSGVPDAVPGDEGSLFIRRTALRESVPRIYVNRQE